MVHSTARPPATAATLAAVSIVAAFDDDDEDEDEDEENDRGALASAASVSRKDGAIVVGRSAAEERERKAAERLASSLRSREGKRRKVREL